MVFLACSWADVWIMQAKSSKKAPVSGSEDLDRLRIIFPRLDFKARFVYSGTTNERSQPLATTCELFSQRTARGLIASASRHSAICDPRNHRILILPADPQAGPSRHITPYSPVRASITSPTPRLRDPLASDI